MALGKNLDNILGGYFGNNDVTLNQQEPTGVTEVVISNIKLSPYQTRQNFDTKKIAKLAQSIKEEGLLNPVTVIKKSTHKEGKEVVELTLLAGERRLRAFKYLKKEKIPAIIREEKDVPPQRQALITANENLQREDLNPLELADTFEMLMRTQNINEKELAQYLECSEQYIKNHLRLKNLSKEVQEAIVEKRISEGQARQLVNLQEKEQIEVLQTILQKELTVKEIIAFLKQKRMKKSRKSKKTPKHSLNQEVINKVERISEYFPNAKVKMQGNQDKGKIIISW